jgi:O-antigen ligase
LTDAALTIPHEAHARALNAVLASTAVWIGAFLSGFVIEEPAPYELYMAALIGVWVIFGIVIPRSAVLLLVFLTVFNIGGVIAMSQMAHWDDALIYIAVSLFLAMTAVFFASVIAARPALLPVIFNGWTVAAVLTGLAGIAGYFNLVPGGEYFTLYGRAKGAFQDPNVFAPYLVLPALYCLHSVLTRPARRAILSSLILVMLTFALFLSFSRAGWGLLVMSSAFLAIALFIGNPSGRFRLRIILLSIFAFAALAITVVIALQFDSVRDIFLERARLVQDYDGSRLGRFARQWIGFKQAMETPLGIGPLEFGKIYGEDTHNIWLKALFDYSWLGFAAYVGLLAVTIAGGFRILFRNRPWQPYLLCTYIVFLGHIAIGNLIDTDHWRHFYILLGIIWGCIALEAQHARKGSA